MHRSGRKNIDRDHAGKRKVPGTNEAVVPVVGERPLR